jgi:hypothetical protein
MCGVSRCMGIATGAGCKVCEDFKSEGINVPFDKEKMMCMCSICRCNCNAFFDKLKTTHTKTSKMEDALDRLPKKGKIELHYYSIITIIN